MLRRKEILEQLQSFGSWVAPNLQVVFYLRLIKAATKFRDTLASRPVDPTEFLWGSRIKVSASECHMMLLLSTKT